MKHLVILLPFPITVNRLYTNIPRIGRAKTKAYKEWEWGAAIALTKQKKFLFEKRVDITLYLDGGRDASDCDNLSKCCNDFLVNHGILTDDSKLYVRSTKQIWDNEHVQNGAMLEIIEIT